MPARNLRLLGGELARFCVVGGLTVLLNNAIVIALTELLGLHYLLSIILCTMLTTLVGFLFNRQWTFRKDGVMHWSELARYTIGVLGGLGVVMALTWGLVHMGLPYYWACLIVAALMAPVNFVLHRIWSFGLREPSAPISLSHAGR